MNLNLILLPIVNIILFGAILYKGCLYDYNVKRKKEIHAILLKWLAYKLMTYMCICH